MRTHSHTRRRYVVAVLVSLAATAGGPAAALAADPAAQVAKIGDTPAEFGQPVAPAPRLGDTPADFPGASRATKSTPPSTITVVRPERTIVRDTDPVLPIALSGAALLIALGLAGTALIRVRSLRLG